MLAKFFSFVSKSANAHAGTAAGKVSSSPSCSSTDDSSGEDSDSDDSGSMGIEYEPQGGRVAPPRARTAPAMSTSCLMGCDDPSSRYPTPRLIHRGKHADIFLARDLETSCTVVLKAFRLCRPATRADLGRHEASVLRLLSSPVDCELALSDSSSCSADTCSAGPRKGPGSSIRSGQTAGAGSSYSCSAPHGVASASGRLCAASGCWAAATCLPGVVQVVDTFSTDQQLFTVMEFCPGVTLIELIANRGGRLSEMMCVEEVVQPLLVTLAALHAAGVVHRQLQPEHVLCHQSATCLIDFLHAADRSTQRLTQRVGTLEYMAPEVIDKPLPDEIFHKVLELGMSEDDLPAYDERCDVWSLGVMVYEALTGCQPFVGDTAAEVAAAQQAAVGAGDARAVPQLIAQHQRLSLAAQDFLCQTLALSPARRASAAELLHHPWLKQLVSVQPLEAQRKPAAAAKPAASGKLKMFISRSGSGMY